MTRNGAKKHYKEAEETAITYSELDTLAECILENLGDKEWATKLYMKIEETGISSYLAGSIHKNLGDKEWAKKIYMQLEEKAESVQHFITLADSIHENFGDKEWVNKLYKKVETKAEDHGEFISLADGIHQNLGDKERAIEFYKIADSKPGADCDDLISHAGYIRDELGDEEWADRILEQAEDKVATWYDLERLAEIVGFNEFASDEPKTEWAEKVCKIAEENAEDISAYESLADWISNTLGNEKMG